ncbi:MAG TPA: hypothetical protein VHV83_06265, partial [Armatimonadota bacterium]|nr:hypothetical protein [Armatimonadota bacterium]
MSNDNNGGGAATQSGTYYQNQVTAWMAVRVLAERDAATLWSLPTDTMFKAISCETEQPVDDLYVVTSDNGFIYIQAKHTLSLETAPNSEFGKTVDEFVRQFSKGCPAIPNLGFNARQLDPSLDRLVLVTSKGSSNPIRLHLPAALHKHRNHSPAVRMNADEREAISKLRNHIKYSWEKYRSGVSPSDHDIDQLLAFIYVNELTFDNDGTSLREAKETLRRSVLSEGSCDEFAWSTLIETSAIYASTRSGGDCSALRNVLIGRGLAIQGVASYRGDIEKIKHRTLIELATQQDYAKIHVGKVKVNVERDVSPDLRHAAEDGSLLVVGEPGTGKSGILYNLATTLIHEGREIVFFAADSVAVRTTGELRTELGLTHDLPEVLANWTNDSRTAFLIIDGLDGSRMEQASDAITRLMQTVITGDTRWHVIASIRTFDARKGSRLHQLFLGTPPQQPFPHPSLSRVRHLFLSSFSPNELMQIREQSPELATVLDQVNPDLQDLLHSPFNLRLLGELIENGVTTGELAPITTQIELLDRFWQERVIRYDDQGDARESLLRLATESMVEQRKLIIDRSVISQQITASTPLNDLLRNRILIEREDRYQVSFAHHVLFDYAVARLLLRSPGRLIRRIEQDPNSVIAIRPSMLLHFQHEWMSSADHQQFWRTVLTMESKSSVPVIGKLIGPAVACELFKALRDVQIPISSVYSSSASEIDAASMALRHLVGAAV